MPVSQGFNGDQVHDVGELRVVKLATIKLRRCREGVDHDESWFALAKWFEHAIRAVYSAKVRDEGSLRHDAVDCRAATFRHRELARIASAIQLWFSGK